MSNGWDVPVSAPENYDDQPLCPAGTFPAAIVGVIDLGSRTEETDYGEAVRRRVGIIYELAVPRPDGQPFCFAETQVFSEYTNSNLYKRYTALVGPPQAGSGTSRPTYNPTHLLGKSCAVSIAHREGGRKQVRTYANLTDVIPPMYGQQPHQPRRQPIAWATFDGTPPPDLSWVPPVFGKTLRSLIESSNEAREGKFPLGAHANPQRPNQQHQRTSQQQPPPQPQQQQYQPQAQHQYQQPQAQYQQPQQQHQQPQVQHQQHQQPQAQQPQAQYQQQPPFQQPRQSQGDDDIPF